MTSLLMEENNVSPSYDVLDLGIRDAKIQITQVLLPLIQSHCLLGETDIRPPKK